MSVFTAACIQLNSQNDMAKNCGMLKTLLREAHAKKADFALLPENAFFMQTPGAGEHPLPDSGIALCRELARELKLWILVGSVHVPAPDGKRWNRSLLIDSQGVITAQYDKIHLFDVTLKNGETYHESARFLGGAQAVVATTPWAPLGMTVCYDLRFAGLYRALAHAGAGMFSVPSAFTYTTGSAHWHTLLRARAIEHGSFVLAAAQCGAHPGNRRTYGHSLIVSPWGEILAEGSEDMPEVIIARIDTDKIDEARGMVPSLLHDRIFKVKQD